jgi:rhodanese-related sulfurtransferase
MAHTLTSPAEAAALASAGRGIILDVRTAAEYREIHVDGSTLVSLDVLDRAKVDQALAGRPLQVLVLCASGIRAAKAAAQLEQAGLTGIHVVEGGIKAWDAQGLPVLRGRKTISIERQVRIGAGLLIVGGALLGFFVHPKLALIPPVIGAGLIFAGVTDICGMATLLAKAPWNRS